MNHHVVCFGAAHMDSKIFSLEKICMGGENLVRTQTTLGGVARNIAENLSRLNVKTMLVSRVGMDEYGDFVLEKSKEHGIDVSHVTRSFCTKTAHYTALLQPDGSLAIALADMSIYDEMSMDKTVLKPFLSSALWVVESNLPDIVLRFLVDNCPESTKIWAVGVSIAKNRKFFSLLEQLDLLIVNEKEYLALHDRKKIKAFVVTRGEKGASLYEGEKITNFNAVATKVMDVTGAGDAFSAGLVFGYLHEGDIAKAIPFALIAAKLTLETAKSVNEKLNREIVNEQVTKYILENIQ